MEQDLLNTQVGMESAFRDYCSNRSRAQTGRVNALCAPEFVSCCYDTKTLTLRYTVQEWMLNPANTMHGGIVSSVFDLTMGLLSCYCAGGVLTPTIQMQVTFLRPIPAGETLVVEATCDMSGKTLCAMNGRAWLQSAPEKMSATSSGTFYAGGSQKLI